MNGPTDAHLDYHTHHAQSIGVTHLDMNALSSPWLNSMPSPAIFPVSHPHLASSSSSSSALSHSSLGTSSYFTSSFASLLSPTNSSASMSGGGFISQMDISSTGNGAALRDPALSQMMHPTLTHASSLGSRTLTPLQTPLTPAPSTGISLFSHPGSGSMVLDILNSSSISSDGAMHRENEPAQDDAMEEDDEPEANQRDEQDEHAAAVNNRRSEQIQPVAEGDNNQPTYESDPDDETYHEGDQDNDADGAADDDDDMESVGGDLLDWVEQSQRSGVAPQVVLQRLLSDYGNLPISNKFLWKTAFNLSLHIQQHLVRASVRRRKLPHVNTLDDVISLIHQSKKIVVLTGAGISVSAGIPDFRSKSGIYPRLKREFGMESPEAMFDLEYFRANPQIFYSFAKELWPGAHQPTIAHRFIAMLEQQGKLLRNYTQNIDALESRAGIKSVLQCHGSFAAASCLTCGETVHGMEIHKEIMNQQVAKCKKCWPPGIPPDEMGEVDENGLDKHNKTFGVMKPVITFFGESLPEAFRTSLEADRDEADLVIVMGSSLKVQPVAGMIQVFNKNTPMILINREVVGKPDEFDVEILGLADQVCEYLAEKLNFPLPEVKPEWNTFATTTPDPLDTDGKSLSQASTATEAEVPSPTSTSASTVATANGVAPSSTAASALSPASRSSTASPIFVAPNRYLFEGSQNVTSSPVPSDCSSAESIELPSQMEQQAEEQEEQQQSEMDDNTLSLSSPKHDHTATEMQTPQLLAIDIGKSAVPLSSDGITSPMSSPLQSPIVGARAIGGMGSPTRSPGRSGIRPPPLHVEQYNRPAEQVVAEMNMVCTPTKSSRFLLLSPQLTPNHSHHHLPPAALSSPQLKSTTATPRETPDLPPSWLGKRKSTTDSITDCSPVAKSVLNAFSDVADSTSATTEAILQIAKRRKISVPEEKTCDKPATPFASTID